jgi:DNA modification methylase
VHLVFAGCLVIDPCLRAGTTVVAAIRCGMRFVGIKVDERTYQAAKARLAGEARDRRS